MRQSIVGGLSASLLFLCVAAAQAADIEVKTGPGPGLAVMIRLQGPFRQGDADAMRQLLARLKGQSKVSPDAPLATVELSSLGGDLNEGLRIGYLFRDYNVATVVRKKDICLSACALAFLGGTSTHGSSERTPSHRLEVGAKLGFHAFYLNPNSAQAPTTDDPLQGRRQGFTEARAATTAVMLYAADLGIDPRFVAAMMTKPQDAFAYVNTTEEFLTLKVCPIALARPAISAAEQAINICNHSTGWTDPSAPAQVRALTPRQAKRYMLENIQQNMSSLKVNGALSDQFASYPVMRDERAIDRLYADLRAAGVRLPEIVGPVFEVSGYRSGGEDMQCFVSLSPDDPNKYAVAIRRPTKWSHPNWSAPKDCRGLYLHDREAVINPRP
ncbi:MAG: hypothetical protein EPO55_10920 [Reyranella sp.]|uniref:COG3904 family protein n=1 Tax=Reyranella sp. TaxID=1929291 RepID=UPI0011FA3F86|nr:hypothetical protein [Reyranella sp.]TAJ39892.1 MAG: hypothetical protein EPO55_10920 [Reyranella sp.]